MHLVVNGQEVVGELPPFVYGLIAIAVFTALQFVLWSYRNVSNRHTHAGTPEEGLHAGGPGADVHGDGHPRDGQR